MMVWIVRMLCQAWWQCIKRNLNDRTIKNCTITLLVCSRLHHHKQQTHAPFVSPPFFCWNEKWFVYLWGKSKIWVCSSFDMHVCSSLSLIPASRNHLQINLKEHILSSLGDFLQCWKAYLHVASLCHVPTWFSLEKKSDCRLEVNSDQEDERIKEAGFRYLGNSQSCIHETYLSDKWKLTN